MRSPIRSPLLVLALLAVSILLVAGCGGSSGEDPQKVLSQTFSSNKKVTSGKLNLTLSITADGVQNVKGPITISLVGPFQSQGSTTLPKFDFDLKIGAQGQNFTAGAISTGDKGFIKLQGNTYAVSPQVFNAFKQGFQRSQAQQNGTKKNPSLASLGVNPKNWLKSPENKGETDVEGTTTIHIATGVDVSKLLDGIGQLLGKANQLGVSQTQRLPATLTAAQKKQIQNAIQDPTFDVYTGKSDKIVRRITIKLKFKVPQASQQRANGLKGGEVTLDVTIAQLNQPQTINAPTNAKPFSDLSSALSGLGALGALSGGSGAGSGATGGTGSTSGNSAKVQAYAQCVQQAAGDISKQQACAKLLTPGG
ncbi:MAG: hypothetical protein ACXVRH_10200 [Thermoleophilaceae bacterium]